MHPHRRRVPPLSDGDTSLFFIFLLPCGPRRMLASLLFTAVLRRLWPVAPCVSKITKLTCGLRIQWGPYVSVVWVDRMVSSVNCLADGGAWLVQGSPVSESSLGRGICGALSAGQFAGSGRATRPKASSRTRVQATTTLTCRVGRNVGHGGSEVGGGSTSRVRGCGWAPRRRSPPPRLCPDTMPRRRAALRHGHFLLLTLYDILAPPYVGPACQ